MGNCGIITPNQIDLEGKEHDLFIEIYGLSNTLIDTKGVDIQTVLLQAH